MFGGAVRSDHHDVAVSPALRRAGIAGAWASALVLAVVLGRWSRAEGSQLAVVWPAAALTWVWLLHASATRRGSALTALGMAAVVAAANAATGVDAVSALLFGAVNAAHALAALAVVRRWGWHGPRAVQTARDGLALLAAAVVSSAVSALTGALVAAWRFDADLGSGLGLLAVRNAVSTAVLGAALLALPHVRTAWRASAVTPHEARLMLVSGLLSYALVGSLRDGSPTAFLLLPLWVWVGARLAPPCVAALVGASSLPVVWQALTGGGALGGVPDPETRVLLAQAFLGVTALVALGLSTSSQERARALASAHASAEELRRHRDASLVGSAVVQRREDGALRLTSANPALAALLGMPVADLEGTDWRTHLTPGGQAALRHVLETAPLQWLGELEHRRGDAATCWAQVALAALPDEHDRWAVQMLDVTERRAAVRALAHQARHDELTGLPKRAVLRERFEAALARLAADEERFAVLFLDLDRFKEVNDARGHDVGDAVLVAMARRLGAAVRPEDTVARLGGDEFVVLCPGLASEAAALAAADRLRAAVCAPLAVHGAELHVGATAGVVVAEPGDTESDLLRRADAAMLDAKRAGRGRSAVPAPRSADATRVPTG